MSIYDIAERVNADVNTSTTYMSDMQQYGIPEFWEAGRKLEDCDGFTLSKRAKCFELGIPSEDINIVTCIVENGERHAVLHVTTEKGSYILDNRYPFPMQPKDLPYQWLTIQRGNQWFELSGFA